MRWIVGLGQADEMLDITEKASYHRLNALDATVIVTLER